MRTWFKKFLIAVLAAAARAVVRKYKPTVVGVTGSVGKTSTKEAIYTVLRDQHTVRRNVKSYNNELGLPLTVIGDESSGKSVGGWARTFLHAFRILRFPTSYPQILILEMGADRPGDIKYLTSVAAPTIAVVTAIAPVHTEFFGSIENVAKEKGTLVQRLVRGGTAVLNEDDERVRALKGQTSGAIITYGWSPDADVRASDLAFSRGADAASFGSSFKIAYRGNVVPVFLPGVVGKPQASAALAAAAVGLTMGRNLVDIVASLRGYQSPPGRMRLVPGIKRTMLLDDSYNASPLAAIAALDTLRDLAGCTRRIACLGTMTELGRYSDEGHASVGAHVALLNLDLLITVGHEAKRIAEAARERGMEEGRVFSFAATPEAGRFLQDRLHANNLILVKGSQAMRMEKIVKELMAEPERAPDLLVRQGPEWQ